MRLGYLMRQQVVAAIHAKVLRLNSASVAYASTGGRPRRAAPGGQGRAGQALLPGARRLRGARTCALPSAGAPPRQQALTLSPAPATGHVVNLASNDVRRFDDALPFWVYVWSAPLETLLVLVMVARELGWVPAVAGVSVLLAVLPLQVGRFWGRRGGEAAARGACGGGRTPVAVCTARPP
jgi:hypothetical protein